MKAQRLFSALNILPDCLELEIDTITENSKEASPSAVFVCVRGANVDGHSFAPDAYARGCRCFVAERALGLPDDAYVLQVESSRYAIAMLACRLYGDPSKELRVIGITGTKGKTTTAQLLAQILNQTAIPTGYIGTNGISFGEIRRQTKNTTPDAVTLQKTLCEMQKNGMKAVVMEVSSQALMQHRVTGIHFEAVLFTNLFPDHIGKNEHPSFEHYKTCKKTLFTSFGAKTMIGNLDDPFCAELQNDTTADRVLLCSANGQKSNYWVERINLISHKRLPTLAFDLLSNTDSQAFTLPLIGKVNVGNAMLAAACAEQLFGISLSASAKVLENASVEGRSELIPLPNGACAVIDYAHNGESLRQLLQSLKEYDHNRLICLFGSVGERTEQRRLEMGKVAASLCDLCILTSDNPGKEDPNKILDEIAAAFANTDTPYQKIADRKEAILSALKETREKDILVLAGKGHETYQLIGDQKLAFCEKEIILEAIEDPIAIF